MSAAFKRRLTSPVMWLLPFALIFGAFQIAPLVWVMISAFKTPTGWGLANFHEIASSAFFRQAI